MFEGRVFEGVCLREVCLKRVFEGNRYAHNAFV